MNTSVGALFHYFESKEKAYEKLIKIRIESAGYPFEIEHTTPLDFLKVSVDYCFKILKNSPTIPKSIKNMVSQINTIEKSVKVIKSGQENKTFRQGNPLSLAIAF